MSQPETRYAPLGQDRVAYQLIGEGPPDLLFTGGLWSNLAITGEDPGIERFTRRLGSFCRLIRLDRRGTGSSDHAGDDGRTALDHWIDDCIAVLDAIGAQAPVIVGMHTAGPLVLQLVARHPERCSGLVFINTTSCRAARPGYPEGYAEDEDARRREAVLQTYGRPESVALTARSQVGNPAFADWYARMQRGMATPRDVATNLELLWRIDSRSVLPTLRVPTLVMARRGLPESALAQARYLAEHIAGARFLELPGADWVPFWETPELILDPIEEFVTGRRMGTEPARTLSTVLFTDIVDSTPLAARLGDTAWRALLDRHDRASAAEIARFGGRLIDRSGDGLLATFERPGNAIDCARALHAALAPLGVRLRTGMHFGEIELREGGRIGGLAVYVGARVMALAGAGEVLTSHAVQGVLLGTRYTFAERGTYELKGVPGKWLLYSVSAPEGTRCASRTSGMD